MLEGILFVNLAFSVVGFFFIVRMWREVKTRRDYYGENFGIPRGKDRTEEKLEPPVVAVPQLDASQIAAIVAAMHEPKPEPQKKPAAMSQGDMEKLVAAIAAGTE